MNIDATEEDLHIAAEALKLAAILDDRAPKADKARIAAWAEKIHRHRLARSDVLDGLQVFYDGPSDRAIQIGDLIHHARNVKRTRIDRESAAELEQRQSNWDSKADVEEVAALTAEAISSRRPRLVSRTERFVAAEAALQTCSGKAESKAAIHEYQAARIEAAKKGAAR